VTWTLSADNCGAACLVSVTLSDDGLPGVPCRSGIWSEVQSFQTSSWRLHWRNVQRNTRLQVCQIRSL